MSEQTNQEEREYTQKEIQEMRDKTLAFYKSQEKVLAAQCAVEEYKARIKKAQFDTLEYSLKLFQINEAMKNAEQEELDVEKTKSE
jgi:hypothetical protein